MAGKLGKSVRCSRTVSTGLTGIGETLGPPRAHLGRGYLLGARTFLAVSTCPAAAFICLGLHFGRGL
jgi:hypothetical protein